MASRALGSEGLGLYALCYGIIVTATGMTSGLIGDTLTVLDRHSPRIRSGLQSLSVVAYLLGALGSGAALVWTAQLDVGAAVVFGLAMIAFQFEETLRRIFMAELRFWTIVIVDGLGVLAAVAYLAVQYRVGALSLLSFLEALLCGQVIASAVGLVLLPKAERAVVRLDPAGVFEVVRFGGWRAVTVTLPGLLQTIVRSLVLAYAGSAALGGLELARMCVAPLQIMVNGLGSYFLASFVRNDDPAGRRRKANQAGWLLVGGTWAGGLVCGLAALQWQDYLTAGRYELSPVAIFCWVVFTSRVAAYMPWFGLAASVADQRRLLLFRVIDVAVASALSWLLLGPAGVAAVWVPLAMTVGQLAGGLLTRREVVRLG